MAGWIDGVGGGAAAAGLGSRFGFTGVGVFGGAVVGVAIGVDLGADVSVGAGVAAVAGFAVVGGISRRQNSNTRGQQHDDTVIQNYSKKV